MTPASAPAVVVYPNAERLAGAVAGRLASALAQAQAASGTASVVLTGGRTGTAVLAALHNPPASDAIDWRRLDVWWGDERFLPRDDPDRNETQARGALLDSVPLDEGRVHPMPSSDGEVGDDPEAAAGRYAEALAAAAGPTDHDAVPTFDVLLLGVGEDGHVASLFPNLPGLRDQRPVVAVRGAPKPPPVRLSLTLRAIAAAREVWLIVTGEDKAAAVELALSGAGELEIPAAGARGRERTRWFLDRAAASKLPPDLATLAAG